MANCLNCKRELSCSCKRRTASNGKSVCTYCLSTYEQIIAKNKNLNIKVSAKDNEPTIINVNVNK
jgi:hypothetical protein